ncbi:MAG: hypothetical protein LHV69_00660 [Elusimicrobia bacterium]|nr:hypothetical protein [Candidatus Obscuribacterium magneticum]
MKKAIEGILSKEVIMNKYRVFLAPDTPPGPAASVYTAKDALMTKDPCTVINCDQYIIFDIKRELDEKGGYLPLYFGLSPSSSYAIIEGGRVKRIVEKDPVSHYASSGVYGFGSGEWLLRALEWQLDSGKPLNGEYFVGPAMNYLIDSGGIVYPTTTFAKFDLGNENGIQRFSTLMNETVGV